MRRRTWAIFIIVNVIVSAGVMLTILFIWERTHSPATAPADRTVTAISPTLTSPAGETAVSSPSPPPLAASTSPAPLVYYVQEGDTLGAIAQTYGVSVEDLMAANGISDPHLLYPGQTLVISTAPPPPPPDEANAEPSPEPTPVDTTPVTPLPTLTPSGPPLIEIAQVLGSGNLAAEVVIVRNRGGAIKLEEWTLSNAEGNTFTFPAITLFTDAQVAIHSSAGNSTPGDLYWGRPSPAWTGGTLITLRDTAGNVVDTYIVP